MARRRRQNVRGEGEEPHAGPGFVIRSVRFVETCAVLLVIAYVATLLISRTDGFRSLLADRLQDLVGMPVKIQQSRARWNLDLVLTGVATKGDDLRSSPGLRVRRVLLDWSPLQSLRHLKMALRGADVDGAEIVLATTVSGQWEPARLAPLSQRITKWLGMDLQKHVKSDAPPVDPPPSVSGDRSAGGALPDLVRLRIRNTNVGWWVGESNEIARLDGLELDVTPVETPGRRLTHYLLNLNEASTSAGFLARKVHVELVDATDQQVVLSFQADNGGPASR